MKTIQALIVICFLGCQIQAQVSFKLSASPGVGSGPRWVAAADVNGDGKLDLINADYYGNSLTVLTNNGNGGFVSAGTYTVGSLPIVVSAADVNRDGKVDLICANSDGADSTLSVLTNNGSGRFVLSGSYHVGTGPAAVTAADVNGDGWVDLISANQGSTGGGNSLTVLTNNGSGGFVLASSPVVGLNSCSVAAADVNGDGKLDLISANKADGTLTVLTNNGSGGFVLASSPVVGSGPFMVTTADVNGDGKVDLITANWGSSGGGNTLTVLTNNGSGIFGSNATLTVGSGPIAVAAADVNGDGKVDLISANHYANSLSVLTNNGNGGFVLATDLSVGGNPNSVTAADVNGDGKVDLISPLYPNPNYVLAVFTNATPFSPSSGPALLLVVPNYLATNDYSFGSGTLREFSRYQEIYGAAEFPTNPIFISQLRFRPNLSGVAPFSTTISNLEVHLSATSRRPDQLSTTFASNVGTNDTIVFQGALTISSQVSGPAGGPKEFDIIVPLTTPFVYNPAAGNLLMDIRNYSGSGAGALSGSSSGSDDCSRAAAFDPNSLTGWTDTGIDALEVVYQPTNLPVAPPVIISQPTNETVIMGQSASFSVNASGTGPLSYQWRKNTTNLVDGGKLSGTRTNTLIISSISGSDAAVYSVIVSNANGSVTSSNAVLTVIPATSPAIGTATITGSFVTGVNITDGGRGYTNTPLVRFIGGGGSGVGAYAVVSNGVVMSIIVTNAGFGYTNAPVVVIDPPLILNPVLGIAPMSFLTFSNLTVGGTYQLQRLFLYYWTNQPVNFMASNTLYAQMVAGAVGSGNYRLALNPVPTQAFAMPQVVNGFVVGATVTSGGSGYVTSPSVTVVGGHGTNATAVSQITGGVVTSINIINPGTGYTNTPTIQIAPPPAAAVFPTVQPVMRVDSASLAPYDNYQIQFKPDIMAPWMNWDGGLFSPTGATNSQYIFITNSVGFFRLQYVP